MNMMERSNEKINRSRRGRKTVLMWKDRDDFTASRGLGEEDVPYSEGHFVHINE